MIGGWARWPAFAALGLILSGCAVADSFQTGPSSGTTPTAPPLPDQGKAPELTNVVWLNSDMALRLADLRGRVVLIDFWTFGCINCQRVVPSLQAWHERYGPEGLVVIGNHFPEFTYEADLARLSQAVERLGITYPVTQDNERRTWDAYATRYWPTLVLIDKVGRIRFRHIGEGAYAETEAAIQALLAESGAG